MPTHKTEIHHAGTKPMSKRTTTHKDEANHATNESETPMKTTRATKTAHVHHTSTNETESAPMTSAIDPATATPTPTPSATATPAAPAPVTALPYIKAPPPISLPAVPSGVVTVPSAQLRGQLPRKQELELMPEVQTELARFTDFDTVFGKTAPSQAVVERTLTVAFQWSTLRIQLAAWLRYATSQEVPAWVNARGIIGRLAPAFALAVKTDSTIGVGYPSLGSLFGVRSMIAKQGVASRAANKKQEKAGLPTYKGAAGKKRRRADEKAALEAQAAKAQPVAVSPAMPVAVPSPAVAPPAASPAAANVATVGHS